MNRFTVGIPTYNGAATICDVISEINKQALRDRIHVEIVVSDNCSDDGTRQIIQNNFANNDFCSIIYNLNDTNIGFDANCDKCVQLSSNEYVWLCSDNEVLCDEKGLLKIVELIDTYEPEFIYLHHETDLKLEGKERYFINGEDYLNVTKFNGGLISNCVVKKSTWVNLGILKYNGCQWIHFAYQIEALAPKREKKDCCILSDIVYKSLPGKERWGHKGSFIDTGLQLVDLFYNNMDRLGYSPKTIKNGINVVKGGYPRNILIARAFGYKFSKEKIKKMEEYFHSFESFYKKDLLAIKIPFIFCRCYYLWGVFITKLKAKINRLIK